MKFRMMLLIGIVGAVMALSSAPAHAGDYVGGYVPAAADEFSWNGTYWVSRIDGYSYNREWVDASCYRNGCYYSCGYWRYIGVPKSYPKAAAAPEPLPELDDPYFEKKLADLILRQDKHKQRIELIKTLGLEGNYAWPKQLYAANAGYSSPFLGRFGVNGFTVHGVRQDVDTYGTLDVDRAAQAASTHIMRAGEAYDKGMTRFDAMLDNENGRRARIAEINAKGAVASQMLSQVRPEPSSRVTTTEFSSGTTAESSSSSTRSRTRVSRTLTFEAVARARCISCHGDNKPAAGYQVLQHPLMSDEDQLAVVNDRLLTSDPDAMMPRDRADPSKPGHALPLEETLLFVPPAKRAEAAKMLAAGK